MSSKTIDRVITAIQIILVTAMLVTFCILFYRQIGSKAGDYDFNEENADPAYVTAKLQEAYKNEN